MRKPPTPNEPEEEPAKQRREGLETGPPQVRFDPERRANYHLDARGERVWHGIPEGFEFNADGVLVKLPPAEPQEG